MSILSAQTIRKISIDTEKERGLIYPFTERTYHKSGLSGGLTCAGYDIHLNRAVVFKDDIKFTTSVTYEHFRMPNDLLGEVKDKSTWIRQGLTVGNTVIEPGWHGYLTLELFYFGPGDLVIESGTPIAQVIFQSLDDYAEKPYNGKYQNQNSLGPTPALFEKGK